MDQSNFLVALANTVKQFVDELVRRINNHERRLSRIEESQFGESFTPTEIK